MKPYVYTTLLLLLVLLCSPAYSQQQVGVFDGSQDVGTQVKAGSATYLPATQQYVVTGAGANIWLDKDEFRYVYKKMKGDFLLYARAEFVGASGINPHRKMGWMVRQSLQGNAPHVSAIEHGDGLTSLQYRRTAGAATEETRATITHANILQLERKGNTYTMRVAQFGQPFVTQQVTEVNLGDDVYVGLAVCSHDADVTETGVFRDVRIVVPAREGLVQYREYLGSSIELLEIATGNREVRYTSPKSLQAPNWTPDGKSLIYNSDGLMYTFNLASNQPTVIPTAEVKSNNNDHVLSFDGTMLGLSSGVEKLGGSIVYTVPTSGGKPKQITPRGPSYLHSWSPDGKNLLFTGQRTDDFNIYRIPATGGKEVRLTSAPGLDDGPEYTPDGKYIYFNSNRTGTMQIWRMRADGSEQVAVTNGDFQDWFPHISPDGKWIAFVSFLKEEVAAGDHPFYKHVYLRLLPIAGGQPKVIAYVYGGQGSMNTPSWSPDSKRVAFISNSTTVAE
ncbi:biopolymer transporter TolR [Hymenobacter tibetensis]|uniref:Biopolymer transporter TolR n=1 Tax=Hymenobacter tibetensis TaxID=497967 RepID=A0ABY4CVP0_9BACT|nr:biopolymer transporter TolR [Hymenobacter tibetensis]UOG73049.1 biopolymer transporter TolR [Hymenobacter tibetensis]